MSKFSDLLFYTGAVLAVPGVIIASDSGHLTLALLGVGMCFGAALVDFINGDFFKTFEKPLDPWHTGE